MDFIFLFLDSLFDFDFDFDLYRVAISQPQSRMFSCIHATHLSPQIPPLSKDSIIPCVPLLLA